MDIDPSSGPGREPDFHPEPRHPAPPHHSDPRHARRRWVKILAGVYALSVVAAFVAIARKEAPKSAQNGDGGESLASGLGLLSSKSKKPGIGWLSIHGVIQGRDGGGGVFEKNRHNFVAKLRKIAKRDDVKSIIIEINSPGGTVGTVQEIYDQIMRVRLEEEKPVIALLNDVAASGGYYIAAACDKIVAHRGTLTGSIGVIFGATEWVELMKKVGVRANPIKSGKFKDIGSASREMTAEERKLLQEIIDVSYEQFVADIVKGRGMTDEAVRKWADGRIFNGAQALNAGYVDDIGGAERAKALAVEMGGLDADEEPRIIREGEPFDRLADFLSEVRGPASGPEALFEKLQAASAPALEYRWTGGF